MLMTNSIILITCLNLQGLATPHFSPIFQMMFAVIVIMHVDDACLNVLIIEGKSALEVIEIGQKLIHVCQLALSVS